ncbi:MAG: CopG family transcriptional regulator [Oleispira sp.]|nr:CopG family transcriptional regulator [Oleispira sp.]
MKKQEQQAKPKTNRLTITLPSDVYGELERRALAQDVSIAWVIRKAVNYYIDADIPLLSSYSEGN